MAKIYKMTVFVVDPNDTFENFEELKEYIRSMNDLDFTMFNFGSRSFQWDDNLPINSYECGREEYEKYFEL
jgi:hypothetical protein